MTLEVVALGSSFLTIDKFGRGMNWLGGKHDGFSFGQVEFEMPTNYKL